MLSKLIGYEFKSTRRIFLAAYAVLIILSLLSAVFLALPENPLPDSDTVWVLLFTVYLLAMVAVCVLSFAYMINRFYKNLLGDEGYLMFTLPASPSQLIWSKCITSTIWMSATTIVCFVSLFFMMVPLTSAVDPQTTFAYLWSMLCESMGELFAQFGANVIIVPIEIIILLIISTINSCMHIYACLSLGALSNQHRLGYAFLAYVIFDIVKQIALVIAAYIVDALPFNFQLDLLNLSSTAMLHLVLIGYIIVVIVCLLVNYLITNRILSKHLNLQ